MTLTIQANLKQVKKSSLDRILTRPCALRELNLLGFNQIGENALSRYVESSRKTLKTFKCSYRCLGISDQFARALSTCSSLDFVELGQPHDNIEKCAYMNLPACKFFAKNTKSRHLKTLRLYECDQQLLESLEGLRELKDLQIVKFIQRKEDLTELLPL